MPAVSKFYCRLFVWEILVCVWVAVVRSLWGVHAEMFMDAPQCAKSISGVPSTLLHLVWDRDDPKQLQPPSPSAGGPLPFKSSMTAS